jgi:hypothetical protein
MPTAAKIATEYLLFGGAGLISLIVFCALILVPAMGSFGRTWEKATAAVVSLFVLAALLLLGVGVGVLIVYEWDNIADLFS